MSIVNMVFVVTLVNAELPKLLEMLESATVAFHEVAVEQATANARLNIALHTVASGAFSDHTEPVVVGLSVQAQQIQCLLDQHRENVALVREVLNQRVLAMTAMKVDYTLVEVEAYRAAMLAKESDSND